MPGTYEGMATMRGLAWCAAVIALVGCAADPEPGPEQSGSGGGGTAGTIAGTGGGTAGGGTAGGGTAGGGMAGGGMAGAGGDMMCDLLPLPANADDLVSTFEDGTGSVQQVAGRGGGFYMFNDATAGAVQTPPTGALPPATMMSRCGGMFALCMSGSGFMTWGAGMGTDLGMTDTTTMAKTTYDASTYRGIQFWAKANVGSALAVRVSMKDKNTAPEGGNCDTTMSSGAEACNDDWGKTLTLTTEWAPYTILYTDMMQSNWGKQFPGFASDAVYSIQFQVNQNLDFDLCIDDLAFVR